MLVSCDSCQARYDYPDNKLRGRGAKFRCSRCSATVVVFPDQHIAIAADHEPTTEDWSSNVLPSRSQPPAAARETTRFDGAPVFPPGTVPPVQRTSAPFAGLDNSPGFPPAFSPPLSESTLSVTPPPPRAIRQPHIPVAEFAEGRGTMPPPMIDETVRFGPPPRTGTTAQPAPRAAGRYTHGGTPIREAQASPSGYSPPVPPPYASYGGPSTTASGAPNRAATGPTDGGPPPRATYGAPYPQQQGHTDPGWTYAAPTPAPAPPHTGGFTVPPWAAYPTWTHSNDPRNYTPATFGARGHTIPPYNFDPTTGVPLMHGTHTGPPPLARPVMAYPPGATQPQATWTWAPMQNGLDRKSLVTLLAAVLVVGFVGACGGVTTGRIVDALSATAVNQAYVPPPSRVMVEQTPSNGSAPVQNTPAPRFKVEK